MTDWEKVIEDFERYYEQLFEDESRLGEHGVIMNSPEERLGKIEIVGKALALLKAQEPITGETSDGYHTFNELYHHRAVLFSVIVANYPDRAWKSKKHHDGTMYNGMFIVGIDTPDGQATYHYDVDPYWDMFKCRVLDNAPEWDGHTPTQAIERIGKLKAQQSRVMALEEVRLLGKDTVVWYEHKGVFRQPRPRVVEFVFDDHITFTDGGVWSFSADGYGERWRLWTSRPTDEQREVESWN